MARRRGFFAQMQQAAARAERDRKRRESASTKQALRVEREAARAKQAAQRAAVVASREQTAAARADEREAQRAYVEAQIAEAASRTTQAAEIVEEIDEVLAATLAVDDYADLAALKVQADRPPFQSHHATPNPPPAAITPPPEPGMPAVPAPKGLAGMLGKKKYAAEVAAATRWYQQAHQQWQAAVAAIPMQQLAVMQTHQHAEQERLTRVATDRDTYDRAQAERDAAAEAHNAELDELIDGLAHGHADAVEEYLGIVLNRSAYPEGLDVAEEIAYDPATHELTVHLTIPPKDAFPAVKSYKYQKSADQLVATPWSDRDQKARYLTFVQHVTLRTLHEVFEADREHLIGTVALDVGVRHIDPALGQDTVTTVAAAAVDRTEFARINLAEVTPAETLKHLHAVVSKDPFGYQPIPPLGGVRG